MRIGEIAILGPDHEVRKRFIEAACQQVDLSKEQLTFGRMPIDEQLALYLYGIPLQQNDSKISWDLLARKMLGYVVLFSWDHPQSLEPVKAALDELTSRYQVSLVVAANINDGPATVPPALVDKGIAITADAKLTFCNVLQPASVRRVLLDLVNLLINKTS